MNIKVKRKIACLAWFPTDSIPYPKLCKVEDDEGEVQLIKDIIVNSIESHKVGWDQANEYKCQAVINGIMRKFKIVYYYNSYEWFIII